MRIVKFYKLKPNNPAQEVVVELFMNEEFDYIEGGAVTPFGEALLINLETTSITVDGNVLSFKDKEVYLRSLNIAFDSPYLNASTYKEQPSEIDFVS